MPKIISIDCFEVYSSFDRDVTHIGYFQDVQDAKHMKARSPYTEYIRFQKTFQICESIADYEQMRAENEKAIALAKLTIREKQILGLID